MRELKNVIERVLILNPRALRIERKHLPPLTHKAGTRSTEEFSTLQQARDAYEREYILKKSKKPATTSAAPPSCWASSAATSTAR